MQSLHEGSWRGNCSPAGQSPIQKPTGFLWPGFPSGLRTFNRKPKLRKPYWFPNASFKGFHLIWPSETRVRCHQQSQCLLAGSWLVGGETTEDNNYWQLVKPGGDQGHHKPDCSYAVGRIEKVSFWWPLQMKLSFLLGDAESGFWVWKRMLWVWWHTVGQKHGGMAATRPYQDINKIKKKDLQKIQQTWSPAYALSHQTQLFSVPVLTWARGPWRQSWCSWVWTCPALPGRQTSPGEDSEHVGWEIIRLLHGVVWIMLCKNIPLSILYLHSLDS